MVLKGMEVWAHFCSCVTSSSTEARIKVEGARTAHLAHPLTIPLTLRMEVLIETSPANLFSFSLLRHFLVAQADTKMRT